MGSGRRLFLLSYTFLLSSYIGQYFKSSFSEFCREKFSVLVPMNLYFAFIHKWQFHCLQKYKTGNNFAFFLKLSLSIHTRLIILFLHLLVLSFFNPFLISISPHNHSSVFDVCLFVWMHFFWMHSYCPSFFSLNLWKCFNLWCPEVV